MSTQTAELAMAPQRDHRGAPRRVGVMLAVGAMVVTVGIGTWVLGDGSKSIGERHTTPSHPTAPLVSEPPIAVAPPPAAPAEKPAKSARKRSNAAESSAKRAAAQPDVISSAASSTAQAGRTP